MEIGGGDGSRGITAFYCLHLLKKEISRPTPKSSVLESLAPKTAQVGRMVLQYSDAQGREH